jgi:uncharacterized protein YprB with RNaseH-like and TPR domain
MNRHEYVVIDIETIPFFPAKLLDIKNQEIDNAILTAIDKIKPDKRLKDHAKIKANLALIEKKKEEKAKEGESKKDAYYLSGALSGCTGKIICVGIGRRSENTSWDVGAWVDSERALLSHIDKIMFDSAPRKIITFNGKSFDLPFIKARMAANSFNPKFKLPGKYDVMNVDIFDELGRNGSLRDWSLSILNKETSGDGRDVYNWFMNKDLESIVKHCQTDVLLTGELFDRIIPTMEVV